MRYLSVFDNDKDILVAFSDIHLKGDWFDLDCTFSKGVFYKDLNLPKYVSDISPQEDFVLQDDATKLVNFEDGSLKSIIFDPPFLFRNRKSKNEDKMSKRFTYFESYDALTEMYFLSLKCFFQKLKNGGYVFLKMSGYD